MLVKDTFFSSAYAKRYKKEVKNADLWKELLVLFDKHQVIFIKVKGHADNEFNNRCDKIAVSEYRKLLEENKI